jgi:hypothetical protein
MAATHVVTQHVTMVGSYTSATYCNAIYIVIDRGEAAARLAVAPGGVLVDTLARPSAANVYISSIASAQKRKYKK